MKNLIVLATLLLASTSFATQVKENCEVMANLSRNHNSSKQEQKITPMTDGEREKREASGKVLGGDILDQVQ